VEPNTLLIDKREICSTYYQNHTHLCHLMVVRSKSNNPDFKHSILELENKLFYAPNLNETTTHTLTAQCMKLRQRSIQTYIRVGR